MAAQMIFSIILHIADVNATGLKFPMVALEPPLCMLEGWDLVQCLPISFCFGSEILKKIGPPRPPKKTKNPKKRLMDFHDGISCLCL